MPETLRRGADRDLHRQQAPGRSSCLGGKERRGTAPRLLQAGPGTQDHPARYSKPRWAVSFVRKPIDSEIHLVHIPTLLSDESTASGVAIRGRLWQQCCSDCHE